MQADAVTHASPARSRPSLFTRLRRSYALRATLQGLLTIYAVMTFTFVLIRALPGNPVEIKIQQLMNTQALNYEEAANIARGLFEFDPNAPILEQYFQYVNNLLHGSLGKSITAPTTTVISLIAQFLPWTLFSVGLGLLISFTLGTLIGVAIAYWRGGLFDNLVTVYASIMYGIPDFVIALLIILIGGVQLGLFRQGDVLGGSDPKIKAGWTVEYIRSLLQHVTLPVLVYVNATIGGWILTMKSSTISALGEDYIAVAKARGLSQRRIMLAYVGRNAMLPQMTRLAISIGFILGGSVIIEIIFQYPGLGRLLYSAVTSRDYTTMQGVFLTISSAVIVSNILADLLYGVLDPRVRVGKGRSG